MSAKLYTLNFVGKTLWRKMFCKSVVVLTWQTKQRKKLWRNSGQKMSSQRILHSCTKCDKKFPRLKSLRRHEKIHNTDEKSFGATKCSKSFITLEYLKKYFITHTLSFSCTKCLMARNKT